MHERALSYTECANTLLVCRCSSADFCCAADVEAVEEELEQDEEDGIKLEAFNLKASCL